MGKRRGILLRMYGELGIVQWDSAQTHVWRVGESAVGFCSDSCPSKVMVSDVWREVDLLRMMTVTMTMQIQIAHIMSQVSCAVQSCEVCSLSQLSSNAPIFNLPHLLAFHHT